MRTGIVVTVSRRRPAGSHCCGPQSPQKHVWRARIGLATADGLGTMAIMQNTAMSKTAVWRWQEPVYEEGLEGLLRDKPSRAKPFGSEVAGRVVALTLAEPPSETAHWTGRAGVS